MTKALYAFSGDPITYGHIDIIERASKVFDELIVAVGINPDKAYTFTLEEREQMAKDALKYLSNVKVTSFNGLLVDFAYENDIPVVIKGVRDEKDFNFELMLYQAGKTQQKGIETFFLPANPKLTHISSSMVKSLQKDQGIVHEYVPLNVKQKLEEKISGQFIIGITGEIATGKTFIANKFIEIGHKKQIEVHNIDLDEIGHKILSELIEPVYQNAREDIAKEFGEELKEKDGMINRKKLGEIVFGDVKKLERLNEITHKLILTRLRREMFGKKGIIILNAALFAETKMNYLFNNNVILVSSDEESQMKRLKERGFDDEQIKRRIESQFDTNKKKETLENEIEKSNHGKLFEFKNNENNDIEINALFESILSYFGIK